MINYLSHNISLNNLQKINLEDKKALNYLKLVIRKITKYKKLKKIVKSSLIIKDLKKIKLPKSKKLIKINN